MKLGMLRTNSFMQTLKQSARYGKPINRWQYYYSNEDGIFEENFNYIEQMTIPQPFPTNHLIFSHKGLPPNLYPSHFNDVRYVHKTYLWPRRHFVPDFKFRLVNNYNFEDLLHGNGFPDFDLDYQLADPMESNHYVQNRSISFNFFMMGFFFVFTIIYPIYGYGIFEVFEDPIKYRKPFFHPMAGMGFTRLDMAVGDNLGLPVKNSPKLGIEIDKDGNPLPRNVRRYSFADEYTFRI